MIQQEECKQNCMKALKIVIDVWPLNSIESISAVAYIEFNAYSATVKNRRRAVCFSNHFCCNLCSCWKTCTISYRGKMHCQASTERKVDG